MLVFSIFSAVELNALKKKTILYIEVLKLGLRLRNKFISYKNAALWDDQGLEIMWEWQ